jgi:Ethanolamine utilization protein EutJ (predicted chaperonin)
MHNRIKSQAASVSKSYSEFGWLLDTIEQEMVREATQKAKDLPPEKSNQQELKDLLSRLESAGAKLTAALLNSPSASTAQAAALQEQAAQQEDASTLVKSALADLKSKKP